MHLRVEPGLSRAMKCAAACPLLLYDTYLTSEFNRVGGRVSFGTAGDSRNDFCAAALVALATET
jgi:hypothetical protein